MGRPSKVKNRQAAWGSRELIKFARKNGAHVENGNGSHFGIFKDGQRIATGYHAREYPKGTRSSIHKMLKAAGLLVVLIIPPVLGGVVALLI